METTAGRTSSIKELDESLAKVSGENLMDNTLNENKVASKNLQDNLAREELTSLAALASVTGSNAAEGGEGCA